MCEFRRVLARVGVLRRDFRFQGFSPLPAGENECVFVVAMPDHDDAVVVGVVCENVRRPECGDVP